MAGCGALRRPGVPEKMRMAPCRASIRLPFPASPGKLCAPRHDGCAGHRVAHGELATGRCAACSQIYYEPENGCPARPWCGTGGAVEVLRGNDLSEGRWLASGEAAPSGPLVRTPGSRPAPSAFAHTPSRCWLKLALERRKAAATLRVPTLPSFLARTGAPLHSFPLRTLSLRRLPCGCRLPDRACSVPAPGRPRDELRNALHSQSNGGAGGGQELSSHARGMVA
jgi:hypothetical protein